MTHLKFTTRPGYKTLDNLFDDLLNVTWNNNRPWNTSVKQATGSPAVNIFETNDAYHLELNAPGRNKEDFKVNFENDLLTISYEKPVKSRFILVDFKIVLKGRIDVKCKKRIEIF